MSQENALAFQPKRQDKIKKRLDKSNDSSRRSATSYNPPLSLKAFKLISMFLSPIFHKVNNRK